VFGELGFGSNNIRVAQAIEGDIMSRTLGTWNSKAFNIIHVAGTDSVVTLHVHGHRYSRDVAKYGGDICT
jgi:hypothetical protein